MIAKNVALLLALIPISIGAQQAFGSEETVSISNPNDYTLIAQDNTPAGMFGAPGSNTIFSVKTLTFTLSEDSVIYLRSDLHQFHASGGHPYVGTRVLVDGVEHTYATGTWVDGSVVPRLAGEYYTTPPGFYTAGTHTATLQIEETGENQVFEVYARPSGS